MAEDVLAINSSTLLSTLQQKTFRCDLLGFMIFEFYARKTFDGLSFNVFVGEKTEKISRMSQEHINVILKSTTLEEGKTWPEVLKNFEGFQSGVEVETFLELFQRYHLITLLSAQITDSASSFKRLI